MSKNDLTMTAGQTVEFYEPGDFFRLLKADSAVKVEFYRNGAEIAEANSVTTGYAEKMRLGEFDRIRITSTAAQAVSFVTRMGNDVFFDAPPTGSVTVTNPVTTVTVANPVSTVTVANPVSTVTVDNPSLDVNVLNPVSTVTVANPVTSVSVNNEVTIANPVTSVTVANPVSTVTIANPVSTVTVANPVTSVAVSNVNGSFTQQQGQPVTNTASNAIFAAKASRRYMFVQNKDPLGDIYIKLDGTAATIATGILIKAGESFEIQGFCPTGVINAIGTIALNNNLVVVEG